MENPGGKQKEMTDQEYYDAKKNLDLPPEDQEPENLNFDMDPKRLPSEIRERQLYGEETTKVMNLLNNLAENGMDDEYAVGKFKEMASNDTPFEEFYKKQRDSLINYANGFRFINCDDWGICMILIENEKGEMKYRNNTELSEEELKNIRKVSIDNLEDCHNFVIRMKNGGTEWQLIQERV